MQNTIVKVCVRDDNNKGAKVEFYHSNDLVRQTPGGERKEEDNLILVGLGGLW
jgi:hypothetical protein